MDNPAEKKSVSGAGSEAPSSDDASNRTLNRRSYLSLAGLSLGATAVAAGSVRGASETIDLGEEGLSEGDEIDPYLESYFTSGTEVHIPGGRYEWNGGGLGYISNAALIGDGTVELHRPSELNAKVACTGGTVTIKNITIRGKAGANYSSIRLSARESDARVVAENFNQPDGSVTESRATGIFVPPEHAGELVLRDCHIEGFADNGVYADSPGGHPTYTPQGGSVIIEGGLYKNNNVANIRIGSPNSIVRDVEIVQDAAAPVQISGGHRQRGIRVSQPGNDLRIENCDIIHEYTGPGWPISFHSGATGGSGVIEDTWITNESTAPAIRTHPDYSGDWYGSNVHIHGSGNLAYGIPIDPVCTGKTCDSEDGADDSENELAIISADGADRVGYSFVVDGPVDRTELGTAPSGSPIRANSNDQITSLDDGRYSVEGLTGNGWGDGFTVDGNVVSFDAWNADSDADPDFWLEWNGAEVTPAELVGEEDQNDEPDIRTLEVAGQFAYRVEVDGEIRPADEHAKWLTEGEAYGDDWAEWWLSGSDSARTVWEFTGEITSLIIEPQDGETDIRTLAVDGRELTANEFEHRGQSSLEVAGQFAYRIEVDGEIKPADEHAKWLTEGEAYGDDWAEWWLSGSESARTVWEFTGEITNFDIADHDGTTEIRTLTVDGRSFDPSSL